MISASTRFCEFMDQLAGRKIRTKCRRVPRTGADEINPRRRCGEIDEMKALIADLEAPGRLARYARSIGERDAPGRRRCTWRRAPACRRFRGSPSRAAVPADAGPDMRADGRARWAPPFGVHMRRVVGDARDRAVSREPCEAKASLSSITSKSLGLMPKPYRRASSSPGQDQSP